MLPRNQQISLRSQKHALVNVRLDTRRPYGPDGFWPQYPSTLDAGLFTVTDDTGWRSHLNLVRAKVRDVDILESTVEAQENPCPHVCVRTSVQSLEFGKFKQAYSGAIRPFFREVLRLALLLVLRLELANFPDLVK